MAGRDASLRLRSQPASRTLVQGAWLANFLRLVNEVARWQIVMSHCPYPHSLLRIRNYKVSGYQTC
jgi:hypothetical protein